jgi:Protein of unknown function (DUF4079)
MSNLRGYLEPIANWFNSLGTPEPIVHWGHPAMMSIVVFVMGSYVAYAGWRSRLTKDGEVAIDSRAAHRKLAPLMFLFIALGYTGGVLSLVMQDQPIFESPHFWTGSSVLILLAANGLIAFTGFGGDNKMLLRTIHAYLGSVAMLLLVIHAIFGLNLGLSI